FIGRTIRGTISVKRIYAVLTLLTLMLASPWVFAQDDHSEPCAPVLRNVQTDGVRQLLAGDPTKRYIVYLVVPYYGQNPLNPEYPRWPQIEEELRYFDLETLAVLESYSTEGRRLVKVNGMGQKLQEASHSPGVLWMGLKPNRRAVHSTLKKGIPLIPERKPPSHNVVVDPAVVDFFSKNKQGLLRVNLTPREVSGGAGNTLEGVVRQFNENHGSRAWHLELVRPARGKEPAIFEINLKTYELCLEFPHLVEKIASALHL
ncbi:MAG TPA: hypothetical protein PLH57_12110, partial [Oligoflexia bacterium]|nr:hypothetical protein [Oligoflexia bacterium]